MEEKKEVLDKEVIEQIKKIPIPPVKELIVSTIGILGTTAFKDLGLLPNPATNLVMKNIPDAKLAIDVIVLLHKQIEERLTDLEKAEFRALIAELQLAYVRETSSI